MKEHGSSTLSPDVSGRIPDRLTGLEKIISPEVVRQVLKDTKRVNARACLLSHEVMMWAVLAMGLLTDDRDKDRHGVVVRVIEYTLNDSQRTGQGEVHRLLTNLLDETLCPALELILLDHFVIRALMFEAARPAKLDVDRLSFTGCLQILQCRLPECDSRTEEAFTTW